MSTPLPRALRDLAPQWAHFCLGLERFADTDLGVVLGRCQVLVALSGGLDSTALLLACVCLASRGGGGVRAAHLDHGLRPGSADDARACQDLCARLDVPLTVHRQDVAAHARAAGLGLEEAGRDLRLGFLEEVRAGTGAQWILLAHHLDDLAEDVLLRLVRGTGWPGLAGMAGRDDARRLLRPLLLTPKARLRAFLEAADLSWREDETNQTALFRRNRLRHGVLPLLQEENPGFLDSVARLWRLGRLDQAFWSDQTARLLPRPLPGRVLLTDAQLEAAPPALRLRLYKQVLDGLGPGQALAETLFQLDQAWQENRLGNLFQLPGDKQVDVTREGLVFSRKNLEY